MKVFSRFTATDKKILTGSFLILLMLSYLLYDDSLLYPRNNHGDQQPVGTLSSLENDVRKKSITDFVWLPGSKKDDIYNQDSIFTGDHSKASVKLADGSIIQIQENSLVNINVKNGQMQLDLRFGQLTGNGKSTIRVKTSSDDYTIDGKDGQFEVNRSASGALDVKVLSGKAEIKGKKGRQDLKSNESLQISDNGVEKNEVTATISLLTKNQSVLYRKKTKDPVSFEWAGKGPITQYQLEISSEASFKKLNTLQMSILQNIKVTEDIKEGSYFWRVKGLDSLRKTIATSEARKFYLSYMLPPQFTSPQNEAVLNPVSLETEEGLQSQFAMAWTAAPKVVKYHWQLSDKPDFSNIVSEKQLSEKSIQTPALSSGKYYARLRGFDAADHLSEWSEPLAINLNIEAEERPPAPKLLNLMTRFNMPILKGRVPSSEEAPQLEWTAVDVARNYHWEISNNPRFVGAKTMDTDLTKVAWPAYKPGKYYYRVFARSELGQLSVASETGVIDVLGTQPVINPVSPVLVKETNPNAKPLPKTLAVSWSPVPGATSYVLQVDRTADFSSPVQKDLHSLTDIVTAPEPGNYFFRVKAMNELGQEISDFSQVQQGTYLFQITLKTPVLLEPTNNTTLFLQKDTEPYVWLAWAPVPNANAYALELSNTPDFSKIFLSKNLHETRFLIKKKIPYGNVYWRVRGISKFEGFNSEWATWKFTIFQQTNQGF